MFQLVRSGILCASFAVMSIGFANQPFLENNTIKINVSLNNFLAISCDTTGNLCTAVGLDANTPNSNLLVYRSSDAGVTWQTPVRLLNAPNSKAANALDIATDIKCDASLQRCFIISSRQINNDVVLIVYSTQPGSQGWSKPTVLPLPHIKRSKEERYIYAKLSCSYSGFSCVIAGTSREGINTVPLLYTTKNAGQTWTLAGSLKKPPRTYSNAVSLYHVDCDNSGFLCKAVGFAITRNGLISRYNTSKPVVYVSEDGGNHWGAPVILPSEIDKLNKASTLNSIKCDGTGMNCIVMGFTTNFITQKNRAYSFITTNGGRTWENKQWINADYSNEDLTAFDCDDAMMNCTAVGYENKKIAHGANGYSLRGLMYSTSTSAQLWEKNTSQLFSRFSYLTDIFCSQDDSSCIAVGVQDEINPIIQTQVAKQLSHSNQLLPISLTMVKAKNNTST